MTTGGRPFRRLAAPFGLLCLAVAFWQLRIVGPIALPQDVGGGNADLYTLYYPLYSFFYRGADVMPPWNPYQLAGTPTNGYLAGGVYYPPHLLYAILPVHRAMGIMAALHIALAGIGAFVLARDLGISILSALVTAVGFMTNELFVGEHLRLQYLEGASWVPFAAVWLRRLLVGPTVRSIAGLAVVVAMQLLTGDAQIVCYEAYAALLIALGSFLLFGSHRQARHAARVCAAALATAVLAILIAGVQLFPTFDVVAGAVRGYGGLTLAQTLPPARTPQLARNAMTSSGLVLLLAGAAVLARGPRRRVVIVALVIGALAAAIGSGTRLYTLVFYHAPGASLFRLPQHMLLIAVLALVVLGGYGLDALRAPSAWPGRIAAFVTMLSLGVAFQNRPGLLPWVVAALAVAAFIVYAARGRAATLAAGLLLIIVTGERFAHTSNTLMIPSANEDAFFAEPPVVRFLRDNVGFDRILVIKNWRDRFPLMEKFGSLHALSVVQDYEPLTPRAYQRFLGELQSTNPDAPLFWGRFVAHPTRGGWRALSLLSTKYVVADATVRWVPLDWTLFRPAYRDAQSVVYENTRALPRVSVVETYEVIDDEDAALTRVRQDTFDPGRTVVLADEPRHEDTAESAQPTAARIVARDATAVTIEASTPRAAFLVLNDFFWPGWTASIDGIPTPIYRANVLFRAVALPPGAHTISFTYANTFQRVAMAISLVVGVACLALVIRPS